MKFFLKNIFCFFILPFFIMLGASVRAVSIEQIQNQGTLKVSTNAEFSPFSYKEGDEVVGIDIDIARKIADSLKVGLSINDVSFDALTLELVNHRCDFAIGGMSTSQERALSVDFSKPYYDASQKIVVLNSSTIKSPEDLKNKKIGVQLGTSGDVYCSENYKDAQIVRYNKVSDTAEDLKNKQLDAIVVDDLPAEKLLRILNGSAKILDSKLFDESYRIALPKGETELLDYINFTIDRLKETGEINEIVEKHIGNSSSSGSNLIAQIYNNLIYKDRYKIILKGLCVTFEITFAAITIGIILGFATALIKVSKNRSKLFKVLNFFANFYTTVFFGTPVIIQLFVIYYLVLSSTGLGKVAIAMIAFGINSGAYVSEIIRSGINSIDHGQYEAGRSLGLSSSVTMRKIILPQAIKNVFPTLVNEFVQLIKETSVAGFIGITDLSRAGEIIRSSTYESLVPLLSVAIIYLIVVTITTYFKSCIERRMRVSDKG